MPALKVSRVGGELVDDSLSQPTELPSQPHESIGKHTEFSSDEQAHASSKVVELDVGKKDNSEVEALESSSSQESKKKQKRWKRVSGPHSPHWLSEVAGSLGKRQLVEVQVAKAVELLFAWRRANGDGATKTILMKDLLCGLKGYNTGTIRVKINKVEKELQSAKNWDSNSSSLANFLMLKEKHSTLLQQEETLSRQRNATVMELIDAITHRWKLDLIKSIFIEDECQQILSIPSLFGVELQMDSNFWLWLDKLVQHEDDTIAGFTATFCWALRKARNEAIFERKVLNPLVVVTMASAMLHDFINANENEVERHYGKDSEGATYWQLPPRKWTKLNTDASCFKDGKTGLGMILRDDQGSVIYSASSLITNYHSPLVVEGLALRFGLQLALDNNQTHIEINSDCLSICNAIHAAMIPFEIQPIILDCKQLLYRLHNYKVTHVSRKCNQPAHILASLDKDYPAAHLCGTASFTVLKSAFSDLMSN
ncbi:hypothetical protein RIF29_38685 [Crotalaria pallida]|uniref:RNase H type-1 domain-containing protein n=1 Tax=Crotalaria pallida TaxID=3830 RepID=A0AAN9HPZ3_CROPI